MLVSASPRRRELLKNLGLSFTVKKPDTEEKIRDSHYRQDIIRVTLEKINSVSCRPGQLLIACDTIVVCGKKVLGKPRNAGEARKFLQLLSGRKHKVLSCVAVKAVRKTGVILRHKTVATKVYFRKISAAEIKAYTKTPVPYDKAGAYGIQSGKGLFVRKITGCYYNVVGLPVSNLLDMLMAI